MLHFKFFIMIEFVTKNWIALLTGLVALIEVIVRLTPTKKDDSIFNFLKKLFDFLIKNRRHDGGVH